MDVRQVYGQGAARPHGQYYPAPEPIRQDPRDLRRQDLCSELVEGACELSWLGLQIDLKNSCACVGASSFVLHVYQWFRLMRFIFGRGLLSRQVPGKY